VGREKLGLKGKMVSTPRGVYSASGGKDIHNMWACKKEDFIWGE
jgi:hypothetical protein